MILDYIKEIKIDVYNKQSEIIKIQSGIIDKLYYLVLQHVDEKDLAKDGVASDVDRAKHLCAQLEFEIDGAEEQNGG